MRPIVLNGAMQEKIISKDRVMDRLDRKILRILQEDSTLAVADLAKKVGLSTTPCWRRIQRMEEDGVIRHMSEWQAIFDHLDPHRQPFGRMAEALLGSGGGFPGGRRVLPDERRRRLPAARRGAGYRRL